MKAQEVSHYFLKYIKTDSDSDAATPFYLAEKKFSNCY